MSQITVNTVVTHTRPHQDEICAILLLMTQGEKKFPGISKAKIEIAGAGGENYQGISADEFLQQGVLMLGVGGGMFDEHPGVEAEGKKGECTSTLVAKYLGIEGDPALKKILDFVHLSDSKAVGQTFDLPIIIKALHNANPQKTEKIIRWAMIALHAKYLFEKKGLDGTADPTFDATFAKIVEKIRQSSEKDGKALKPILAFLEKAKPGALHPGFDLIGLTRVIHQVYSPEKAFNWAIMGLEAKYQQQKAFLWAQENFDKIAKIHEVLGPGGEMLKLVIGQTDNTELGKVARTKGAGIVIQKNSKGQVGIYTNKGLRGKNGRPLTLTIYDVCQMIRLEEQYLNGIIKTYDWKDLAREGKVAGAEAWYFHDEGQMLMNGSLSNPDVVPTRIPLETIQEIVQIGINPNAFEPSRQATCRQGECTSTVHDQCPWYERGLHRCRKLRYEAIEAKA